MPVRAEEVRRGTLWEYRFALQNLVLKDFRVRYRNMSLGFLWSIVNPLVMLGVLVFVFTKLVGHGRGEFFAVRVLIGIIIFNFFSMCASSATGCIMDNASLVKKIIFPRHVIPVSVVLAQLIHLAIQLLVLVVFLVWFRVPVTWHYLWLPLVFLVELVFTTGVAFVFSALNVQFRDVQYIVQSGLAVLFWFTPIFYSLQEAHQNLARSAYFVYLLNPLAGCVNAARYAIVLGRAPDAVAFGVAALTAVVTLALGVGVFQRMQRNFADCI